MFTNLIQEVMNRAPVLLFDTDTSTTDVWAPINNLKDILLAGFASVGVIVILVAIVTFATAWVSHDTSQKITALYIFLAGCILIGAGVFLSAIVPGA